MKNIRQLKGNCTDQQTLTDIILNSTPDAFKKITQSAIEFAKEAHKGQKRLSGEDFYLHPMNVAAIVSGMKMDTTSVITSLLHNTLISNDPVLDKQRLQAIKKKFGAEVASMVSTVHEFSQATRSRSDKETISRYILRSSNDLRLVMIKLADRLHNARTIDSLSPNKQKLVAQNLMGIYAPLSTYLNMYEVKKELEEIAFRVLNPEEYKYIDTILKERRDVDEKRLNKISKHLQELASTNIKGNATVYGRIKGHYSIYMKLERNALHTDRSKIDAIMDLLAFTILLPTVEDCYEMTMVLMKNGHVDLHLYDDYIKQPKDNGYRSIHLILMPNGVSDRCYEVQLKTPEMHHYNIYGPASHIGYKGITGSDKATNTYYWVKDVHKRIYEYNQSLKEEMSVPIRSNLFDNKIYVFTPSNELIEMPIGSTVIDLAYRLHSNIGNKAESALVNSEDVPLDQMLKNGDHVEINLDEKRTLPKREWLQFVRTRRARDAIETEFKNNLLKEDPDFTFPI